ncbi:MAG: cysteine desulfurase/selenocysteine lyase [Candidatus Omnitrophota bacterium]|jgi:cysteine desulfurase/selenocysteine lyase
MKPFDVKTIRKDFPNLNVSVCDKPVVYLDNAATTFKPQCVIDAITNHYTNETSNVHRGVHTLSEKATSAYEGARGTIQKFINAEHEKEIIFTKGTTDAINLVAASYGRPFLNKGDEILITAMEHHSNIVPWQMLCEEKGCILKVIPINDRGELLVDDLDTYLTNKTKFVSVVYISNSLGTINPVKTIIDRAHALNVPVLLDGAQAVTHARIDVQKLDCDFFVFSGHKLFGPTGCGVLYGKKALLEQMAPYQGGGDMIKTVSFKGTVYNDLPYKFEAGTPNIAGFIGLDAAIKYVQDFDWDAIKAHKKELLDYATDQLSAIENLKIIGTASDKTSVISFVIKDVHAHDLGTLVNHEGVAVRTGHHCTMPVMEFFNISATSRASFSWYNTKEEVDTLVRAIKQAQAIFN